MELIINPNYELLIQILFVWIIIKMIANFICGIAQCNIVKRDTYGFPEIFVGLLLFVLIIWLLI